MIKRTLVLTSVALILGIAAWQTASALQSAATPAPAKPAAASAVAAVKPKPALGNSKLATPMAQRVATIGLLNKRNGLSRNLTMKPGEAVRINDVIIKLQACETTAPWENEKLTGAFVQVINRKADDKWYKIFSGWLYKESPSLNVVEHPVYDIWVKDCQMRHPDIGEDTIIARDGDIAPDGTGEPE